MQDELHSPNTQLPSRREQKWLGCTQQILNMNVMLHRSSTYVALIIYL